MCVAWRSTPKSPTSSPAALMTKPSKSGTSNQGRASRRWPGTPTGEFITCVRAVHSSILHLLTYLQHRVLSVCFSADGKFIASGSKDNTVKIWSAGSSGTFECQSTLIPATAINRLERRWILLKRPRCDRDRMGAVSYTHLTLPTNREV